MNLFPRQYDVRASVVRRATFRPTVERSSMCLEIADFTHADCLTARCECECHRAVVVDEGPTA